MLGSVKQFIWKACNNLLPSKMNLAKRKAVENELCPICGITENVIHILGECLASYDVWGKGDNPLRKWSIQLLDFWSFWVYLVDKTSKYNRELCSTICKNIWNHKNLFIFEDRFDSPRVLYQQAQSQVINYQAAQPSSPHSSTPEDRTLKWQPPPHNVLKANWDGGLTTTSLVQVALSKMILAIFLPPFVSKVQLSHLPSLQKFQPSSKV